MTRKPRKSDRNVMGGLQFRDIVRTLVLSIIFVLIGGECVMANDFDNGFMKLGAFSISESGGLEYGSRQMSFDGENKFYFAKGDTINDETQTGVGVFVLNLQDSDVQQLKGVARVLCDRDIQTGGPETHDPAATFSVACLNEDKVVQKSGSLRLIPDRFRHQVFSVPLRLSEQARTDGRKIIKLDFTTVSIGRKSDNYVVAVRFINSGSRWIKFKTPDQWNGTSLGGRLGVGAIAKNNQNGEVDEVRRSWAFGLGGKKIN